MAKALKVAVVGDWPSAALEVAGDLDQCGFATTSFLAGSESDLDRVAADCDLIVACHPVATFSVLRVLELWGTRRAAPPVVVYGEVFSDDDFAAFMRAGARDCLRRGDLRRIKAALERETTAAVARRAREGTESEDRYRTLIEEIPALTYVAFADDTGSRAYVSPQLLSMTGFNPSEWLAEPDMWARLLHPDDRDSVLRQFREACARGGIFASEYRLLDREGRVLWWRDEGKVLTGPEGKARLVRGFVLDITEQKLAEESLRRLRYYDPVTGLANRALLQQLLGQDLVEASRSGRPLALLILALDRFREMAFTLGPQNGILIARDLAGRLGDALGDADRVARLRGAEFGLLLPGADAALAQQVGERVLKSLDRPFMVQRLPIEVSGSIGIAVAPEHGNEAETLLRRAVAAVEAAKQIGGVSVLYSPACEPHDPNQLALLGELRRDLEGNKLQLHFQPKVDLKTNRVVGAEALLRWPHVKRGLVPPASFIPDAEKTGLIRPLTRWVLDRAVAEARAWARSGQRLSVAVNVSARSLRDGRLLDDVEEALLKHDLAPQRLVIEVTESAVLTDEGRAAEVLSRLVSRGISVAIDDFGTGYTSLGLLRKLRAAELKIDKSFVMGMKGDGGEDTAIVRSTAELAHNLGMSVVAEGVEDQWTLDQLAMFGCDQAQGYHIARPMPGPAYAEWVRESSWRTVES